MSTPTTPTTPSTANDRRPHHSHSIIFNTLPTIRTEHPHPRQGRPLKVSAYQPRPTPRSSPSPSPPPPPTASTPPFQAVREKRRSFNTQRAPTPNGRPTVRAPNILDRPTSSAPGGSDSSDEDTIEQDDGVDRTKRNGKDIASGAAVEGLESPVASDGQLDKSRLRGRVGSTGQHDASRML
jgi:hypothetical protein